MVRSEVIRRRLNKLDEYVDVLARFQRYSLEEFLARTMHEPPAATADMAVLPGVLASRTLRRTDKYA